MIKIEIKNYDDIQNRFFKSPARMTAELNKAIQRIIMKIERDAKKEAPVNKQGGGGNLRQSIRSMMLGPASGKVEVGANYGIFIELGTKPHEIRVRTKQCLANKRTGNIFGKVVNHPGTKANPFFKRAIDSNMDFINQQFAEAVENVFK